MNASFFAPIGIKNNAKNRIEIHEVDRQISLALVENQDSDPLPLRSELQPEMIQFYFCTGGKLEVSFHEGGYKRALEGGHCFLFYHPENKLPHELILAPNTRLLALFLSVRRLHSMFLQDATELPFLDRENISRRFYQELPMHLPLQMVVDQLYAADPAPNTASLFFLGKVMEIMSLYFGEKSENKSESCPFLLTEDHVSKIRQAKQVIISQMIDPPALKELARTVGLNEYQLKVGFKNIYGNTVFRYLHEYRMEYARKKMDEGEVRVNEVSSEVGYQNPSHFIAAFKKKYGVTPKKYLQFAQNH
jgi:AraC-like DNA-binding protein